jgi:hypothetical protein
MHFLPNFCIPRMTLLSYENRYDTLNIVVTTGFADENVQIEHARERCMINVFTWDKSNK